MTQKIKVEKNEKPDEQEQSVVLQFKQEPLITTFDTNINIPELEINVVDYKSTKFFMTTQQKYTFNIISSTSKQVITHERTSKDFQWLISTIKTKYPGIGIPVYNISSSELNLTKQKCIVSTLFLNRLYDHPVLKYSPEVQSFFLDKIQYLSKRKIIQSSGISFNKISSWSVSSLLLHVQKLTKTNQNQSKTQMPPLMKQLLQYQKQVINTINTLKLFLYSLKQYSKQTEQVHKKQISIFQANTRINELQKQQVSIRQLFGKINQTIKQQSTTNYLKVDLIINVVMENLIEYQNIFKTMLSLQSSIESNAFTNDYQKLHATQEYLSLLINNMKADIKGWLEYNNDLISTIIDMVY